MPSLSLHLHPGREQAVLRGHPWIFAGAITEFPARLTAGEIVTLRDAEGKFLGRGYVNPACTIAVRLLTREDESIDAAWVARRVASALELRRLVLDESTTAARLLNGEGDGLPGIVVDRYGAVLVLQCLTAGAERLKPWLVEALRDLVAPVAIVERSAGAVRREEGLEPAESILWGTLPHGPVEILEHGLRFEVDVRHGQKTGFFLDQRENRRLVRQLATDRRVLNAFSYTGGFSLAAAAGGARSVVSVESSPRAVALAARNWQANGFTVPHEAVTADVFEYLRRTDESFDLLVLDPPALVKRRREIPAGTRAYKDLHLQALRRAAPGALLATFSCSQHVDRELFRKVIGGAAQDAGRPLQILKELGPGLDHPLNLAHPEGSYLKGFLLRAP